MISKEEAIPPEEEQPPKKTSSVSVYVSIERLFWDLGDNDKATFGWMMLNDCNNDDDFDMCLLEPVPEMSTDDYTSEILGHSDSPPSSLPPGLISLDNCGCAAYESKIYIISGKNRYTREYSRELFIYDTTTKKWDTQPSKMNTNRASPGLEVVAVENVIYVFGGILDGPFTGENLAECCDLSDNSWEWTLLPKPPKKFGLTKRDPFVSYLALYHLRQQILVWVAPSGRRAKLYSYHYLTGEWSAFGKGIEDSYPTLQYRMAVVGDLLYCHYFDKIYVYHLTKNRIAGTYDLDNDFNPADVEKFGKPHYEGEYTPNGFLVHTGKGNLFVMCFHGYGNDLHCYKFQISNDDSDKDGGGRRAAAGGRSSSTLPLTFKGTKSIPTFGNSIKHALVVA